MDEARREALTTATVGYLDEVRSAFLRTPAANVLKHWDMLLERVRLACRTSASVEEWATTLARSLKLPAPSSSVSSALKELEVVVKHGGTAAEWLTWLEREHAFVLASLRLRTETRKEEKRAAQGL